MNEDLYTQLRERVGEMRKEGGASGDWWTRQVAYAAEELVRQVEEERANRPPPVTRTGLTQKEKVRRMLWSAGERGICSTEFLEARLPRVAARVWDLRWEGIAILTVPCTIHTHQTPQVRYRLACIACRGTGRVVTKPRQWGPWHGTSDPSTVRQIPCPKCQVKEEQ